MLKSIIITIGDEILIGQIVDTNSAWLASELNKIGVSVSAMSSIGDTRQEIISTLSSAIENYNLVFITGGLGPTKDDITKQVLCEIFGGELVNHTPSYEQNSRNLARLGVEMNELNQSQSYVPSSCEVIINQNGTAPGMIFQRGDNRLFAMPGVPFEMKAMCESSVFNYIKSKYALKDNIHRSITTFGIAESILAKQIESWESSLPDYLHLAYLPNPSRVRLRLSAYQVDNPQDVEKEIDEQFEKLKSIIPNFFMGEEGSEVEVVLSELLRDRGETVSTAESCSGGAIASKITRLAGASDVFKGSIIAYENSIKIEVLGVDKNELDECGAVSREVVEQMAQGVRRIMKTDYSIASSGIAGPSGGSEQKPVGTIWIAIDTPQGVFSQKLLFGKLREPNIEKTSSRAIYMLVEHITKLYTEK